MGCKGSEVRVFSPRLLTNKTRCKTICYSGFFNATKGFKKYFGELTGEKLTRPPLGYPVTHPDIEFLKMKNYPIMSLITGGAILFASFGRLRLPGEYNYVPG
jgi:hypothetical protein